MKYSTRLALAAVSVMTPLPLVKDGRAPESQLATRRDQSDAVTRSRPVCAYPLVARYKGSGSTDDAANFLCSSGC